MKLILSLATLLFAAPFVQAQVVVTNPISDILSQTMHVEDIAKTVEMINNQVKQITTLTQQLQQIQAYVKAFGDPEKLTQITGADQLISSLKQSGVGKTIGELRHAVCLRCASEMTSDTALYEIGEARRIRRTLSLSSGHSH